jgi:hypothetical protein
MGTARPTEVVSPAEVGVDKPTNDTLRGVNTDLAIGFLRAAFAGSSGPCGPFQPFQSCATHVYGWLRHTAQRQDEDQHH